MSTEATGPLRDVFISHASEDKQLANALCATLEQQQLRCWIAPRDIVAGSTWGKVIIEAIDQCRVIVVVVSSASNHSAYVLREVERAIHRGLPVLPMRIEDVPLSKELELFLSSTHWLNAISPPVEQHFIHLADSIKALLSGAAPPPPPPPRRRLRPLLIAAVLALAGGLAAWKFWPLHLNPAARYQSVPAILKAADEGDPEAQWRLAQRYCEGDGVTKDLEQAAKWCRKAADQGHRAAATRLGSLYFYGDGVTASRYDAEQWWLKAADKGDQLAQLYLGKAYQNGDLASGVNLRRAAEYLRKAAEQGHAEAASRLGYLYERGDGVDRDYAEAAHWYLIAAEKDEIPAQLSLAALYSEGKGVLKNHEAAIRWYKRAADQDDPSAQNTLGLTAEFGDPDQPKGHTPDYAEAVRWYQRSADQDHPMGQFNLGRCYENGFGLPQSYPQATLWYALAKDRFDPAREAFLRVEEELLPQEQQAVSDAVRTWQPKR